MTPESLEVAAMIDSYPDDIRRRLRDAMGRIVDVYRESGVPELRHKPRQLALWRCAEGSNVIEVAAFRRKSARRAGRQKGATDEAARG